MQGVATGNVDFPLILTNASTATCRLTGYPALVGITPSGDEIPINLGHGTFFGNLVATDLSPGSSGELLLGGTDQCEAEPTTTGSRPGPTTSYTSLIIELPGRKGSVRVANHLQCGVADESQLGIAPTPPGTPQAGTLPFLQAQVQIDSQIRPGQVFHYVVVLSNEGSKPISLLPCPGYTEALYLKGGRQSCNSTRMTVDLPA